MAGENFVSDNKFGIVSSAVLTEDDLDNIFSEEEVAPISKKKEKEPETEKKEEKPPVKQTITPILEDDIVEEEAEEIEEDGIPEGQAGEEKTELKEGVFESIAEELYNLGIFSSEEGKERKPITTGEEFRDRFAYESQKQVEVIIERFLDSKGEETRDMFNALFVDGVSSKDYLEKFVRIQDVENLDLADEGNQEKVVRELYKREGKKDIEGKIEKLKTYGDLEEAAVEAKELILSKDKESIEQERNNAKAKDLQKAQIRQDKIQKVNIILTDKVNKKEFDGIPVSKELAQKVLNNLTRDAFETPKGEKLTTWEKEILDLNRPENYERLTKLALLNELLKTDPTLSTIQKKAVSVESNKLFQKVAHQVSKTKETKQPQTKPMSWFN